LGGRLLGTVAEYPLALAGTGNCHVGFLDSKVSAFLGLWLIGPAFLVLFSFMAIPVSAVYWDHSHGRGGGVG
jgi:hypothetical protein